jgi:hypothetical protein
MVAQYIMVAVCDRGGLIVARKQKERKEEAGVSIFPRRAHL